jgi:hypothetical protein
MIFIWRLGKILKLCGWKIKDHDLVQAFGFAKGNEVLVGNRLVWEVMLWKCLLMFNESEFEFFIKDRNIIDLLCMWKIM